MLPFTRDQFMGIFVEYNAGVWPAQVVAYLVGLIMLAMVVRPSGAGGRIIGAGLATMWIWTRVVYHSLYFSAINKAALVFGTLFVLQGIRLIFAGVTGRLRFGARSGASLWLDWAFVVHASVIYSWVGLWAGHRYPEMPMFGITPCPVTIFTFGLVLLATPPVPWWLLVVPFIWPLIGGSAAFLLAVRQDWLLLVSGVAAAAVVRRKHARRPMTMTA